MDCEIYVLPEDDIARSYIVYSDVISQWESSSFLVGCCWSRQDISHFNLLDDHFTRYSCVMTTSLSKEDCATTWENFTPLKTSTPKKKMMHHCPLCYIDKVESLDSDFVTSDFHKKIETLPSTSPTIRRPLKSYGSWKVSREDFGFENLDFHISKFLNWRLGLGECSVWNLEFSDLMTLWDEAGRKWWFGIWNWDFGIFKP